MAGQALGDAQRCRGVALQEAAHGRDARAREAPGVQRIPAPRVLAEQRRAREVRCALTQTSRAGGRPR